jgi:subtilisin family serine protease
MNQLVTAAEPGGLQIGVPLNRRLLQLALAGGCAVSSACGIGGGPDSSGETSVHAVQVQVTHPQIPSVDELDRNANRIDDRLDDEIRRINERLDTAITADDSDAAIHELDTFITLEAIFSEPISEREIRLFTTNGVVHHVFRHVGFGFVGSLPRRAVERTARELGASLLLMKGEETIVPHLHDATRTARIRPLWSPSFLGGFSGSPSIVIAILDTGVDASHPDLVGRMAGWKDYTIEAAAQPSDRRGHGTHTAGVALGSGSSFGLGPNVLHYTDSGDAAGLAKSDWHKNPIRLPSNYDIVSTAKWIGGGATTLALMRNVSESTNEYAVVTSVSGLSPLTLAVKGTNAANERFSLALFQNTSGGVGRFSIANVVNDYPSAGDGFPVFRGVAPASRWFGAKVLPSVGNGTTTAIAVAMDDIVALRTALNIKVVNMSFGLELGGTDVTLRAKANTLVEHGIVVVTSAGNDGVGIVTPDPGRAGKVITVGAVNDQSALTHYTNGGFAAGGDGVDLKPDLLAPGGSIFRSRVLSCDTNFSDADDPAIEDVRSDDYTEMVGTSVAAPIIAGSAALLIESLERSGMSWNFQTSDSALQVKMLLLASSTETNALRELGRGSPGLGRAAVPKDNFEGYGIVNPDAAIEAATMVYDWLPIIGSTNGTPTDRRAWGRKIFARAGKTLKLSLHVPETGDFDLYVYRSLPDANGNPVLLAWSDRAGAGVDETLATKFTKDTTVHAFVKRISGYGTFTLSGYAFDCGNGRIEPGEECDDGSPCCSALCELDLKSACAERTDAGVDPLDASHLFAGGGGCACGMPPGATTGSQAAPTLIVVAFCVFCRKCHKRLAS